MSHKLHRKDAPKSVSCAVVTVSDTRTKADDESGKIIKDILSQAGHAIAHYDIIRDEREMITEKINSLASAKVDVIITNGGTGISRRDVTIEAVAPMLEKELPGFGEIFRHLSFEEIGAPAMLSRAIAGVIKGTLVICLPGSRNAVRLGVESIAGELGHFVWEVRK